MLYEKWLRPALFRLDPEKAHKIAAAALAGIGRLPLGKDALSLSCGFRVRGLETQAFGLNFDNPVGLAAGFDKDCRLARVLPSLGFGFLELGSVTLRPQHGNPKPRIFRIPEEEALVNRMGFNSAGAKAAALRLKGMRSRVPIGINLGLNADCPAEKAVEAYAENFEILVPYGDYFVINISSPNTPGLRALQDRLLLEKILRVIAGKNWAKRPILVKLDPDIEPGQLPALLEVIQGLASGVVAGNTTLSRPGFSGHYGDIRGGLSGRPLAKPATGLIRAIHRSTKGRLPIIGAGGIFSGQDAYEKILAGAGLLQIYTALIYRGPGVVRRIQRELSELLSRDGFRRVADAVGREVEE